MQELTLPGEKQFLDLHMMECNTMPLDLNENNDFSHYNAEHSDGSSENSSSSSISDNVYSYPRDTQSVGNSGQFDGSGSMKEYGKEYGYGYDEQLASQRAYYCKSDSPSEINNRDEVEDESKSGGSSEYLNLSGSSADGMTPSYASLQPATLTSINRNLNQYQSYEDFGPMLGAADGTTDSSSGSLQQQQQHVTNTPTPTAPSGYSHSQYSRHEYYPALECKEEQDQDYYGSQVMNTPHTTNQQNYHQSEYTVAAIGTPTGQNNVTIQMPPGISPVPASISPHRGQSGYLPTQLEEAQETAGVYLCNRELWGKFYVHTNEMIITKQGR